MSQSTNSWLFTADPKSMYTNIDTNHAIEVISKWLDSLSLPKRFLLAAVKAAMELAMHNNIFVWGDRCFLQLLGIAMGTSSACMWSISKCVPVTIEHIQLYRHNLN